MLLNSLEQPNNNIDSKSVKREVLFTSIAERKIPILPYRSEIWVTNKNNRNNMRAAEMNSYGQAREN